MGDTNWNDTTNRQKFEKIGDTKRLQMGKKSDKKTRKMGDTNWNDTTNGRKFEKIGDTKWHKYKRTKLVIPRSPSGATLGLKNGNILG